MGKIELPPPSAESGTLEGALKADAHRLGFDLVGIAPAVSPGGFAHFSEWIADGFAGEMHYLPRRAAAYEHPRHVLPSVRSVVMLAINYNTHTSHTIPEQDSRIESPARVARYAQGSADYHDLLRGKLKQLAETLHEQRPGLSYAGRRGYRPAART